MKSTSQTRCFSTGWAFGLSLVFGLLSSTDLRAGVILTDPEMTATPSPSHSDQERGEEQSPAGWLGSMTETAQHSGTGAPPRTTGNPFGVSALPGQFCPVLTSLQVTRLPTEPQVILAWVLPSGLFRPPKD
jgi:hypothetical protein